ncbi:polysaccharide pyruvyl transferase family protein [Porticoccus sp.]|uniref:polysaccharide pyruvyl transferase family protein n=1 Tax=Porticoccus sp. TaxID=2024853 RepID=UPI003F6A02F5
MKLICVINRYNDPNYGDIGICRSITHFLEDNGYTVKNFDFIGRRLKFQFTRTIHILSKIYAARKEKPECLLVGGGQLLLNNRNFPYALLGWYLVSKISGIPLVAYSVGGEISEKQGRFYRWVLRLFLSQAKTVYLRDDITVKLVSQLVGFHFETVPDAVYLSYQHIDVSGLECSDTVVFVSTNSVPKQEVHAHYNRILAVCGQAASSRVKISVSSEQDIKAAERFYDYAQQSGIDISIEPAQSFEQFIRQISAAKLVISSRMHPLIYAHLLGKPFVAIPTNNKTQSMSEFLLKKSPENLADEAKKKLLIALK